MKRKHNILFVATMLFSTCGAFVRPNQSQALPIHPVGYPTPPLQFQRITRSKTNGWNDNSNPLYHRQIVPISLRRQRRSVANIQTMGLFGLGGAEIAIILIAIVFVFGPNQLGNMAGKVAGRIKGEYDGLPDELKKIPQEFQKGMEESVENARARNAKQMEKVSDDEND
ncbi:hypothetical protein IV203_005796 [Nitzschia inconspicua]|uniref:Uncharacterized protein n=1 Tax=Nitzschia inconspicua TaxID=303405 RepID=A0A9K3KN12_9STRA|nr:hypothetical protein IV203_005796 [Nitzschia inconspicua]